MTLLSALAPSMMNSRQTVGSSPRSIRLSISAWTHSGIFGRPLDQAERMLIAVAVDAEGGDQHQVVANMQAIDLDDQQVELG